MGNRFAVPGDIRSRSLTVQLIRIRIRWYPRNYYCRELNYSHLPYFHGVGTSLLTECAQTSHDEAGSYRKTHESRVINLSILFRFSALGLRFAGLAKMRRAWPTFRSSFHGIRPIVERFFLVATCPTHHLHLQSSRTTAR